MTYVPKLASERYMDPHEAGFDSCVYCSVAMLADAAMGKPVTTPQALEAIDDPNRMKVGTTMPAALAALAGTSATARKAITYLDGQNDTIDGLLASGEGLAVTGLYSALPAHYQRWDPAFAAKGSKSGHAMYIQRDGPNGPKAKNVWLLDPLAEPGYAGEWLPTEALHAFIATRVQHAAAPIAAPPEDDMTITRLKAEDWRPVAGHGVWRHTP
ncbi:MAG TPA: hypothetical protein VFW92_11845, partial [Candidatus Limnocylindrales bacterium]|nr:hypothetical protein [Candidatus Limnocylindrales bacterium]